MKEGHRYGDYYGNLMEPYPPTLEVRFGKDKIKDLVKDKYELNAYLLGRIFSVTKDPGNIKSNEESNLLEDSDSSDSSSDSSLSLFDSTENNDEKEDEISQKSSSTANLKEQKFSTPLPRYPEARDGIFQRSQSALKVSITRSASARTLENAEQIFEENERKEQELEVEQRKQDKLQRFENKLDVDLLNKETCELYNELKQEEKSQREANDISLMEFEKQNIKFRKLVSKIKIGTAKDETSLESIISEAVNCYSFDHLYEQGKGIDTSVDPKTRLMEWCLMMNKEVKEFGTERNDLTKEDEPWTEEDYPRIKVLKL